MKKYLSLLVVLILPFMISAAETCDVDKVKITGIEVLETKGVAEKSPATFTGLTADTNLKFKNIGDTITYKVDIKNEAGDTFKITNGDFSKVSEYITYSLEGGDILIKAGEVKSVNLTIKYAKEVPSTNFVNSVYSENNSIPLKLSTGNLVNTGLQNLLSNKTFIVVTAITLGVVGYILFKNRKNLKARHLVFTALSLVIIPITASALCEGTLTINGKIEIEGKKEFCIITENCEPFSERIVGKAAEPQLMPTTSTCVIPNYCRFTNYNSIKVPPSRPNKNYSFYSESFGGPRIVDLDLDLNYIEYKAGDKISLDYLKSIFGTTSNTAYEENVFFWNKDIIDRLGKLDSYYKAFLKDIETLTGKTVENTQNVYDVLHEYYQGDIQKVNDFIKNNTNYIVLDQLDSQMFDSINREIELALPTEIKGIEEGCYIVRMPFR